MKASELKHTLMFIDDDDDVEFIVSNSNSKNLRYVAEPVCAEIKTSWTVPKRGDLSADPDDCSKFLTIFLEIPEAT